MKKLTRLLSIFTFSMILFSACNFGEVDSGDSQKPLTDQTSQSETEKAYIQIQLGDGSSRSILPSLTLKDFVLKGNRAGEEEETLLTAETAAELESQTLIILTGNWSFSMTAQIAEGSTTTSDVGQYAASISAEISNATNSLLFDMKPVTSSGQEVTAGELSVSLSFADENQSVSKAKLSLKNHSTGEEVASQDFENITTASTIDFSKSLTEGTYEISIEFFFEVSNGIIRQNKWQAIARITRGLKSSAIVRDFSLSQIYTISYQNIEGAELDESVANNIAILSFTGKSSDITLPVYKKSGFYFMGWYESENPPLSSIPDNKIETFSPKAEPEDKTFYALWAENTVYVADSGSGNGFSGTSPVSNFSEALTAISKIKDTAGSAQDFTIKVCGEVKGCQSIPSDFTTSTATTLTIEGETGNESDILNGNNGGTTLSVATAVPVTIKNLKITGGSAENGGGINNSRTLSLSDGCLVAGNTASNFGGGVYSTGTMFMYGSAVIGDCDSTKNESATESDYSNKAGCGAGIYSLGNLYLGYSAANTKTELKGGVFYNFSHDTGGIYQYANKTFLMNSGSVSYNAGRGIYVGNCSFTMSGGSVIGNTTFEPGNDYQTNGAGIYAGVASTVLISGGTISGNEAGEDGGGLYIAKPETSVTIEGGTISGNSADGKGNGIAIADGYLKMKGNASVDSNNDVYLASGKVITVTGELTGTNPVATITPATWTRGTTIVQADGTNLSTLKDGEYDYTKYFAISDADWVTKLSSDKDKLFLDAPIYVAGSGHSDRTADGSDETGNGTKSKPFATINKAVTVMDDNTADYTIYIDGTVTGTQTIPDTLKRDGTGTNNAQSLTIEGVNDLDENLEPKDILDGNENGTTLTINSNVPVTITNLKITKGNGTGNSSKYGGGIYISDSASLALGNGALVTQNTAAFGGGIFNLGKLFLYGTAMVGMQTNSVATSDNCGNKATECGAGIFVSTEGQIYLGYRNENEKEMLTGGVCGNYNAGIIDEYDQDFPGGGGIHLSGSTDTAKIEIASGNISYNYAVNGAGIYAMGNVTMTGGTIEGNEGNSADTTNGKGGGIYLSNYSGSSYRTFTMSGSAVIKNNKNIAFGAGVYLRNQYSKFEMKGGEISENIALSNGGAVYLNDRPSFYIQGEANIPYGGGANKNDIYMRYTTIKITAPLSGDRDAGNVIGLTPSSWTRGKTVVQADGTNLSTLKEDGEYDYTNYFALSDEDWVTKLSTDNKSLMIDAPIYVAGQNAETNPVTKKAGSDSNKGTKSSPFATIAKAVSVMDDNTVDYTIYIDGTLTGVQSISDSSILANSLTIQGTRSSATINGNNAGPALQLGAAIPNLSILRLTITGGKTSYRGGGIYTYNNSGSDKRIITLGDGTEDNGVTITSNTAEYGGGIYIDTCYELTITNGCEISDNQATHDYSDVAGGGVYNAGSFIMTGGKINNNQAMRNSSAGDGGGIYNDYGTVYLSGGEIKSNVAAVNGGGIYRYHGNIFVYDSAAIESNDAACGGGIFTTGTSAIAEDGTKKANTGFLYIGYSNASTVPATCAVSISQNTARGSGSSGQGGGGIHIASGTTVYMAGGIISENTADNGMGGGINNIGTLTMVGGTIEKNMAQYGAGVLCAEGAAFTMEDGTISENTASNFGGAVYNAGTFNIKGSASIPYGVEGATGDGKNDVHLLANKYITVTGELGGNGIMAAITADSWSRGKEVIKAGTGVTLTVSYLSRFQTTNEDWDLVLSSSTSITIDTPIYVAGSGYKVCKASGNDSTGDGSKSKPYATITKAYEQMNDITRDYIINIDGTLSGSHTLPDTLKSDGNGTNNAKSLTLLGVNGINANHEPIATLDGGFSSTNTGRVLLIETDVPITIKALTIKNGYLNEDSDWEGGGIYISSSSTVTLGDEGSVNGDYTNTVLFTNNSGVYGNAIYSEGALTLGNCTFKNNNVADHSSSFTQGDNSPAIKFKTNDLILAGGNIHFSSNTPGDIYIGAKTSNAGTGFSTPCKIQINVALPDDFSASLCAFGTAWAYSRLGSKQILNGLSSEYSKFSLYGITDTAHTYSIDSSGTIIQAE